jgi:hypothetical protein
MFAPWHFPAVYVIDVYLDRKRKLTAPYYSELESERLDTTNDEIIPRSEVATILAQAQTESWGPIGTVPIDMIESCVITKLPSKLTLTLSTQYLIEAAQIFHSKTNGMGAIFHGSETSGSAQLEIIEIQRTEQVVEGVEDKDQVLMEEPGLSRRNIRRIEVWREEVARCSDSESAVSDASTE